MMANTRLGPIRSALLILLLAAVWFGQLPVRALIKSDEGRYAEIAREMHVSGDWVTPRMNDLKYFYKPPLQYWATAAAYGVAAPPLVARHIMARTHTPARTARPNAAANRGSVRQLGAKARASLR